MVLTLLYKCVYKYDNNALKIINKYKVKQFKENTPALTGVAQWIECRPVKQRVTGSIPSQGTCLAKFLEGGA